MLRYAHSVKAYGSAHAISFPPSIARVTSGLGVHYFQLKAPLKETFGISPDALRFLAPPPAPSTFFYGYDELREYVQYWTCRQLLSFALTAPLNAASSAFALFLSPMNLYAGYLPVLALTEDHAVPSSARAAFVHIISCPLLTSFYTFVRLTFK